MDCKCKVADNRSNTKVKNNSTKERNLAVEIPYYCFYSIMTLLSIDERLIFEGVCTKWKDVSCGGWRDIKQLYPDMYNDANFCRILQRCGSYLHRLHVDFAPKDNKGKKNHKSYNEQYMRNAVLFTKIISKHCLQLKSIIIDWLPLMQVEDSQQFWKNIQILFENNQELETIQLRNTRAAEVRKFVQFMPRNVNTLHLSLISNEFRHYGELSVNLTEFERLEVLSLHRFCLTGGSLQAIEKMKNLKFLSINKCLLTTEFVRTLSNLVNLEHLKVSWLPCWDFGISYLLSQFAKIKILDLYGSCVDGTGDTMNAISTYCPNLEELRMDRNFFICRDRLPRFKNLRKLRCYDWAGYSNHQNQIAELIYDSPKLTHLEATYEVIHPYLQQIDEALSRRSSQLPLEIQLREPDCGRLDLQFENSSKLLSVTYM